MSSVKTHVSERYAEGAKEVQPTLCCPVSYDTSLLKMLPQEIVDKDYGCGDPSRYVRAGDTVLDLGSGGGKICYMAAHLVGETGRVIGVDMTDDMLALARKYQDEMATKLGGNRVEFLKGHIQDLALNVEEMETYLAANPINNAEDLGRLEAWQHQQRKNTPMIADNSVDLIISNCVLNLVSDEQKAQLVSEIFRVLKPGGRVAISDIISDEVSPAHLKEDAHLWSGCISGAFQEKEFIDAFLDAGFQAISYDKWDGEPWQVVEGIEFRSATLLATKPSREACLDYGHAVIYRGPFSEVHDDDNHVFYRGERMAVCERTYKFLTEGPFADHFIGIPPAVAKEPVPYCAPAGTRRAISESKGAAHNTSCCGVESGCC